MASSLDPSRVAGAADAREVGALLDRFNAEYNEYTPGADVLSERVRDHVERDLSVFLLAGPQDVGVAQLRLRDSLFSDGLTCYLEELYVVPGRRGEGHGRMLMETAFALARERGASTMELGTAVSDEAARGLYESLGFSNLEVEGDPSSQMLYYDRDL